jgi:lysine 2,3-aminomutase
MLESGFHEAIAPSTSAARVTPGGSLGTSLRDATPEELVVPSGVSPSRALEENLEHRVLLEGEFWRRFAAYANVDTATFLDPRWQLQNSITAVADLSALLGGHTEAFLNDLQAGLARAPMALRLTPYMLSLIDWEEPETDPIRRQFLPLGSEKLSNHPVAVLDALNERSSSPVNRLTHRYPDRVLLVATDVCPVYCRYCTRSYSVGGDTNSVSKRKLRLNGRSSRWAEAMAYIKATPAVEDVVISGGDAYMLKPSELRDIGQTLLDIPHVRRMRFATKGLGVMPMKLLGDEPWVAELTAIAERGRSLGKEVSVHTHIAHPAEITDITARAARVLWDRGITVRNQAVLLRGVNDQIETLQLLVRRLSYLNIHPYYLFQHDFVPGVEELRTPLHRTLKLEKALRGTTAGYNMPNFVVDLLGGGGKRDAHSYEVYDRTTGIAVYVSPVVHPDSLFFHFDPLDTLPREGQKRWACAEEIPEMIEEARRTARSCD